MATAHLIRGFLGVGKTMLARRLEQDIPAIRFSHDEWMTRLYGDDPTVAERGSNFLAEAGASGLPPVNTASRHH
jgi:predicted kinase